jgi:predicted dinucleotide-binding enzyme
MKVLLLGGTGAMGIPLANELALKGVDVYITSRRKHHNNENIRYIFGDAMNDIFINEVLLQRFDVIVDFMIYTEDKLKSRIN